MVTQPPPSRYRVVERGRRLVVIDTQAGSHPPMGDYSDPPPAPASAEPVFDDSPLELAADAWPSASEPERETIAGRAMPSALDPAPVAEPPLAAQKMIAGPPELLRNVASTVCGDARDGDGRLVFTTATFYDAKGPRRIALDPDGERALGLATLVLLAVSVAAIIFVVTTGWFAIVIVVVAVSALRQAKAIATPWIDRLAARTR